jgi:histidine triad (HIT) family protein
MTVEETDNCIFCKIVRGDFGTEFVAESANAVAFRDIQPSAPIHILVVPKRHVSSLAALESDDQALAGELVMLAAEVAREQGVAESGYRLIANTGSDGGQTVFHLHFHLLGGTKLPASLIARD